MVNGAPPESGPLSTTMKKQKLLLAATLSLLTSTALSQAAPSAARTGAKTTRSWVTLQSSTGHTHFAPGQPITVHLTATNTFKKGAFLRFTSGQRFDFSVYPVGKSDSAYTWSATRMFAQSLGSLWLKPGQSQSFDATIGDEMGQLQPGKYRLEAHLTNSPRPIFAAPIEFEVAAPALAVKASTDKTTYKIGEPVQIGATVTNTTDAPKTVDIRWGMICDFIITDEAGNAVWNYGANLRFIRILGATTWTKGETKTMSATWNGVALPGSTTPTKLQPGRYRVQAVLQTDPQLASTPVTIELTN